MNIQINLGDRDVGSTAVVTERRWSRKVSTEYLCVKGDKIGGARWVNSKTGEYAHWILEVEINSRAQNAVRMAVAKGLMAA